MNTIRKSKPVLIRKFIFIFLLLILVTGCSQKPSVIHSLSNEDYTLINQDSSVVHFPGDYKGKLVVLGFIYTHCPDICPMITHNIFLIKQELDAKNVNDVIYIGISFDPDRDTPSVLKQFANIRDINTVNFHFLTGKKDVIKSLLKNAGITTIPNDSTVVDGELSYYFMHTDRISVMDTEGNIRIEYKGSTANIEELIKDINKIR